MSVVRILGEGQFQVDDAQLDRLNSLDSILESALEDGAPDAFRSALSELLAAVRAGGTALPPESLEPSDVVLPFADSTPDEVRDLLAEDGLIPG